MPRLPTVIKMFYSDVAFKYNIVSCNCGVKIVSRSVSYDIIWERSESMIIKYLISFPENVYWAGICYRLTSFLRWLGCILRSHSSRKHMRAHITITTAVCLTWTAFLLIGLANARARTDPQNPHARTLPQATHTHTQTVCISWSVCLSFGRAFYIGLQRTTFVLHQVTLVT